jgi:hypothetical protein
MASASRSGAVVVGAELVLGLALAIAPMPGAFDRRLRRPFVVLALVAAFAAIAGWDTLWLRFHWGDDARLRYARASLAMIQAAPWHGAGLGCWPTAYPMYATVDDGLVANQAHSDWLQWAAEGGLPFAVLLLSLAAALSARALRSPWAIGIPAVFGLALADYPFEKPAVALLLFTVAGALVAAKRRQP